MILGFDTGVLLLAGECWKKIARRDKSRKDARVWRMRHPGKGAEIIAKLRREHPERVRNYELRRLKPVRAADARRRRAENRDRYNAYARGRRLLNLERGRALARARYRARRDSDVVFKILQQIRVRVRCALAGRGSKSARTVSLLGCDGVRLRNHLESLFQPGMSWATYGRAGWHIDHIRPCSSFDLSDPAQQQACFHFTNLQPLWAEDNLRKGARVLMSP